MNRQSDPETVSVGPPLQSFVDQADDRRPVRVRGNNSKRETKSHLAPLRRLLLDLPLADRLVLLKDLLADLSPKQLASLLDKPRR